MTGHIDALIWDIEHKPAVGAVRGERADLYSPWEIGQLLRALAISRGADAVRQLAEEAIAAAG